MIGGFGDDSLYSQGVGDDIIFGNEGNDTINVWLDNDTVFAGQGNDSAYVVNGAGSPVYYMNEGNDTFVGESVFPMTVVGGNDSADGSDYIYTKGATNLVFGNGGNDIIEAGVGADTVVGGFGADIIFAGQGDNVIFGNESNDTILGSSDPGDDTVFAGQGDDTVNTGSDHDMINGNEGNDTIDGYSGSDTISGGSGADVFLYDDSRHDGDHAAGGGTIELIADLDFAADRFDVAVQVTFAANVGAGIAASLGESAHYAIVTAATVSGGAGAHVAAQFTFGGRTYLAIDQAGFGFTDVDDLLLDITGVTGSIATSNFI
jgi:Ca2+-binding RTX toxin-like protein